MSILRIMVYVLIVMLLLSACGGARAGDNTVGFEPENVHMVVVTNDALISADIYVTSYPDMKGFRILTVPSNSERKVYVRHSMFPHGSTYFRACWSSFGNSRCGISNPTPVTPVFYVTINPENRTNRRVEIWATD